MIYEPGHPDTTLKDWKQFRKHFSPFRFSEVIDRDELDLPDWFVPLARGVAVPSDFVLHRVGCRPNSRRPDSWVRITGDEFRRNGDLYGLTVRRFGDLWMIGRFHRRELYILVFTFGSTPIFTRTYQSAMRLAQHCARIHVETFGYCWVPARPVNCDGAISLAKKRRVQEANLLS